MKKSKRRVVFDNAKRLFDIFASGTALLLVMPVLSIVALLVFSKLGRPVLFRQHRAGLNGRPFELLKFRTMLIVDEKSGRVTNEQRVTPFGLRLREWSLDELPSLWNVFRGDMSLVGPRPLLMSYLPKYTSIQARRHNVRPGITGLSQVSGRNTLDWDRRLYLDVWYVENRSFTLDAHIIFRTFIQVARRDGIVSEGHIVGAPFGGNARDKGL